MKKRPIYISRSELAEFGFIDYAKKRAEQDTAKVKRGIVNIRNKIDQASWNVYEKKLNLDNKINEASNKLVDSVVINPIKNKAKRDIEKLEAVVDDGIFEVRKQGYYANKKLRVKARARLAKIKLISARKKLSSNILASAKDAGKISAKVPTQGISFLGNMSAEYLKGLGQGALEGAFGEVSRAGTLKALGATAIIGAGAYMGSKLAGNRYGGYYGRENILQKGLRKVRQAMSGIGNRVNSRNINYIGRGIARLSSMPSKNLAMFEGEPKGGFAALWDDARESARKGLRIGASSGIAKTASTLVNDFTQDLLNTVNPRKWTIRNIKRTLSDWNPYDKNVPGIKGLLLEKKGIGDRIAYGRKYGLRSGIKAGLLGTGVIGSGIGAGIIARNLVNQNNKEPNGVKNV